MGAANAEAKKDEEVLGRDELNLAEFPVALIGKRPPGDVKTLRFEDQVFDRARGEYVKRTLTVTGSDLWGLPSQFDDEVLLACIQLTKEQGFKDRKIEFTRYDLLRLLGRPADGRNYQRVSESLDRWAGTLFISDKAWWDKESQCWVKDTFNIIDRVNLVEKETVEQRRRAGKKGVQKSWLMWGDFMWRSFQAGNLKELDFEFWKSLQRGISKRLYRILDKRFYHKPVVAFDLHTLAYEKIGLSRNMHTGQIKEKLRPANEELEQRGVCSGEFVRKERGKWEVVYTQHGKKKTEVLGTETGPVVAELTKRGVSAKKAARLVEHFSKERIEEKLRLFDWHKAQGRKKRAGFLVAAIEDDYLLPEELQGRGSPQPKAAPPASRKPEEPANDADSEKAKAFVAYLETLTEDELAELEAEALAGASPFVREKYAAYRKESGTRFEALRRGLLEKAVRSRAAREELVAS